ncbi:kinesin light chain, partial [Setomelanomma holmii]
VIETRKRALGDKHLDTLTSMANLLSTYWNQMRWNEAEELEVQVMETSSRALGNEHLGKLTSINNLTFTVRSQSRDKEAFSLLEICIQLRKQILGEQYPHTKLSLTALENGRQGKVR